MNYLLIEDECAPDSFEAFDREFAKLVGLTVKEFQALAKPIESNEFGKVYNGFVLEYFPEAPQYHLSKLGDHIYLL